MRLARDMGTVSELYPAGFSRLTDLPYPFHDAMTAAIRTIGWQDELDADEMPPRRIWDDAEALNSHFQMVNRRRKARVEGKEVEDEVENQAAQGLIVG